MIAVSGRHFQNPGFDNGDHYIQGFLKIAKLDTEKVLVLLIFLTHTHDNEEIYGYTGLEIRGCQEPKSPLNSPAGPSNFCRTPKDVLLELHSPLTNSSGSSIRAGELSSG